MPAPIRITDSNETILNIQSDGPSLIGYTNLFDYDGNGNLIYQGWALSYQSNGGSPNAASGIWSIKKFTYNGSNQITTIQWANGQPSLINVWNNRASLNYQ